MATSVRCNADELARSPSDHRFITTDRDLEQRWFALSSLGPQRHPTTGVQRRDGSIINGGTKTGHVAE